MYYEINVSRNGKHIFATHQRSCTSSYDLNILVPLFEAKFPDSEGYKVTVSRAQLISHELDGQEIDHLTRRYRNA